MALLAIDEADGSGKNPSVLSGRPFLRLGFRPFYLLGAAFAAISIPAWLLRYYGLATSFTHIDMNWHARDIERKPEIDIDSSVMDTPKNKETL